jgi:hypothetical protein
MDDVGSLAYTLVGPHLIPDRSCGNLVPRVRIDDGAVLAAGIAASSPGPSSVACPRGT